MHLYGKCVGGKVNKCNQNQSNKLFFYIPCKHRFLSKNINNKTMEVVNLLTTDTDHTNHISINIFFIVFKRF